MIRITVEFESGWLTITEKILNEFKLDGLKSYKIEIIKDKERLKNEN